MPGFRGTLKEFKAGKLHSGSKTGPIVKNRKQALAIALSEQRKEKDDMPMKRSMRLKKMMMGGK